MKTSALTPELLYRMDAYWRAANYLSVGQIYLYDNPLLKEPLKLSHVKPLVVGHWGTTPGQNFIYVHLNRVIKKYDLDMFYIAGPGHGGPAIVGNVYLEGTWSEVYPSVTQDEAGLKKLFTQFSWPGGISSHVAPTTPGSIHEGGELGYSLSHAFGAVFDNPGLIVACVIGDGEAETGPLATAWQSNKLLDPITDGAVLPILHLNGFKISNPTVLARIEHEELEQFFCGCGWMPYFVEGNEPEKMHELMATTLDKVIDDIRKFQENARKKNDATRPRWPMIVLKSPKGWTGPKVVDGLQIEGTFRAHQVPLLVDAGHPDHVAQLESWMKSYKPEELFDENGRLMPELLELAPKEGRRMGANPHTNGGILLRDLRMPNFRDYALTIPSPGAVDGQDTLVLGNFLRDVAIQNQDQRNFRIFGPDETLSNLLGAVFEVTNRQWDAQSEKSDEFLAPTGRVVDSMLSEHQCEGFLEGYRFGVRLGSVFRLRLRWNIGLRLGRHLRAVKNPIGQQLHTVIEQEPDQCIAPHEGRPPPTERRHEYAVDGDQRCERLGAEHGNPQNPRRAYGPERPARARQKNRQMPGDRQLQIHQCLDMRPVEMEDTFSKVE